jgi:hypothetical protein
MNRSDGLALAGVIVASFAGINFARTFADHPYFSGKPFWELSIVAAGWMLATYGPIITAALFWRLAKRSALPWLFHVLLLPMFYGLLLAGNAVMLSMLDVPDFDDTLGAPMMPAFFCTIATAIVYFSALAARGLLKLNARSSGS